MEFPGWSSILESLEPLMKGAGPGDLIREMEPRRAGQLDAVSFSGLARHWLAVNAGKLSSRPR